MITLIIPIDLQYRAKDILERCKNLLDIFGLTNINIAFGHNNRNLNEDNLFFSLIKKYPNASVATGFFYKGNVNSSILRNRAVEITKTEKICLLDIDIWPDISLILKYSELLSKNSQPFYIIPCLYLTKRGSRLLIKDLISKKQLIAKYFSYSRKEFLHIASPSSITIMNKTDFCLINGFNEEYKGHGYEDFDFLIRLAKLHKKLEVYDDFIISNKARSPLFATGFRRALGMLSLVPLFEKDIAIHIYHGRGDLDKYKKSRNENLELFKSIHSNYCSQGKRNDPTLITDFLEIVRNHRADLEEYSIFFDNKPSHIDRFDTFKRRLRFLING